MSSPDIRVVGRWIRTDWAVFVIQTIIGTNHNFHSMQIFFTYLDCIRIQKRLNSDEIIFYLIKYLKTLSTKHCKFVFFVSPLTLYIFPFILSIVQFLLLLGSRCSDKLKKKCTKSDAIKEMQLIAKILVNQSKFSYLFFLVF